MFDIAIGQLSKLAHCKVPTIRYYEEIGLLPTPARNAGNQRRYSEKDLLKLQFIRHARALGFDLEAIRELLQFQEAPNHGSHEADEIARRHLQTIEQKITRLQALQTELSRMLGACEHHNGDHNCRVLEVLADHTLCAGDHDLPPPRE